MLWMNMDPDPFTDPRWIRIRIVILAWIRILNRIEWTRIPIAGFKTPFAQVSGLQIGVLTQNIRIIDDPHGQVYTSTTASLWILFCMTSMYNISGWVPIFFTNWHYIKSAFISYRTKPQKNLAIHMKLTTVNELGGSLDNGVSNAHGFGFQVRKIFKE